MRDRGFFLDLLVLKGTTGPGVALVQMVTPTPDPPLPHASVTPEGAS
jgi:hypothetical protein